MSDLPVAAASDADARPDGDVTAATDAIVVRLGSGRFAVDLGSVAEVGRAPHVTRVPGFPTWLAGVANWRGRILPVLDLRTLLGADAVALDARGRLLVLTHGKHVFALVVDAVEGTALLGSDVAAFPRASGSLGTALLSGQVPREDGPIAVIDVAAVVRLRDSLPQGRRSA